MHRPKRSFGREFKLQLVRQVESGERRPAQICREHQLSQSLPKRWRDQYREQGENAWGDQEPGPHRERDPEQRIAALEAALGRAHLEIDFLRLAVKKGGSLPTRNGG